MDAGVSVRLILLKRYRPLNKKVLTTYLGPPMIDRSDSVFQEKKG